MPSEIKVIASVAFKDVYLAMLPDFEKSTNCRVNTLWLPTVEIMQRLKGDDTADLIIISGAGIDELIQLGKLQALSRKNYLRSGIGIGMQRGATRPDLSTQEAFKQALLQAKSVAYSTGPSGVYLAALFEKMGMTAALAPKLILVQGEPVGEVVRRGEAEIGLQQIPEILAVPEIDFVGPLPPEIQVMTTFAFGIHENVSDVRAVQAWMQRLQDDTALPLIHQYGLEPAW
jgi:molybdate transport system substrate-binding protein